MASTMETWAKVMGAKAVVGGGIEKMNAMLSGEAKMLKNQRKRQRVEEKEQKKLMLAEEAATHKNWLRDHGSLIQAVKDGVSGYAYMTAEQREAVDSAKEEETKAKIQKTKLRKQGFASILSGINAEDWATQLIYNTAIAQKNQADKALKKKAKDDEKKNAIRLQALAQEIQQLGKFKKMGENEIIELIKAKELKTEQNELNEKIANAEEEYLGIAKKKKEDAEAGP